MTSRWPMMTLFSSATITSREWRNSSRSWVIRSPALDIPAPKPRRWERRTGRRPTGTPVRSSASRNEAGRRTECRHRPDSLHCRPRAVGRFKRGMPPRHPGLSQLAEDRHSQNKRPILLRFVIAPIHWTGIGRIRRRRHGGSGRGRRRATMMTPMMMSWLALGMPGVDAAVVQDGHDQAADQGAQHGPLAAAQAPAADDDGRDHLEFQAVGRAGSPVASR